MTIVSDHPWLKAYKLRNIYMNVVRMEHHANLLWIPADSEYNINEDWLEKFFKKNERDQIVLFKSNNVLTPKALHEMLNIHKHVQNITVDGKTFDNICATVPIADIFQTKKRRKRQTQGENEDPVDNTTYDDEEYDFWGGEYDEYPEETEEIVTPVKRINFEKYGNKSV